jgi:hypothetical protein
VGTGPIGPDVWGVATISVDRYTFQTVPIPEPQTYVLMLAGLGAIGVLSIRRRRDV